MNSNEVCTNVLVPIGALGLGVDEGDVERGVAFVNAEAQCADRHKNVYTDFIWIHRVFWANLSK